MQKFRQEDTLPKLMGYHLEDEYEGFKNHLICNCESGFLPPLSDVERDLASLADSSL